MSQAWLDSLSEDWVSEPRSDASQAQLPPSSPQSKSSPSRIPRFNTRPPTSPRPARDSSVHVLSERSVNDVNIKSAQRAPSKLSGEMKSSQRRRYLTRSNSSAGGSVVHNTVQHSKSQSSSPTKGKEDVPEWKRRLIYGELNYGESKDLFSSAGTGLENIFRPPTMPDAADEEAAENEGHTAHETTLPSSPPCLRFRGASPDLSELLERSGDESSMQPRPPPPKMTFRRTEDDSEGDISRDQDSFAEKSLDGQVAGTNPASENSVASLNVKHISDASRKTSSQSDGRNEYFSPILISCHNSENGKMSFAPVEPQQLRSKLEKLRRNQMILDTEPEIYVTQDSGAQGDESQNFETTEDYAKNGGYLNLRRGGRSEDGSFRRRPLSPPLITDTSDMLPESSLQASTPKQFFASRTSRTVSTDRQDSPTTPKSPALPRAPHPSPAKLLQVPTSNGVSPLKLFGPYDTFTNQTLMRRISQFEDEMNNNPVRTGEGEANGLPAVRSSSRSRISRSSGAELKPRQPSQATYDHRETSDAANMFGAGELDDYEFTEDISLNYSEPSHINNKENMEPSEMPSNNTVKFDIHQDLSVDESLLVQRARNNVRFSRPFEDLRPHTSSGVHEADFGSQATPQRYASEGKRPRTSPCKDPTPKRRRTLHRSDIAYGLEDRSSATETMRSSYYDVQSVFGKRRKEARQNNILQFAGSNMMAARPILRPQQQSPTRRPSSFVGRKPLANLAVHTEDQRSGMSADFCESDISVQDFATDGSRKTSIKTQDFFEAAEEIMAMIRDKARPRTELEDVAESEAESAEERSWEESRAVEDSFQDSTKEPFSRPPSRDGVPIARVPARQDNPDIADRLKRYEERSDLGDIILTHPMQAIGRMRNTIHRSNRGIISDLSNVRISRNPDYAQAADNDLEYPSNFSQLSGSSTEHSLPTASSRGSDSRRLIGPDVVSQLIGDQVGNMVFDRENKKWQKVKISRPASRARNILLSEDSEDDPFASIPDLSVDTAKETQNLGLAASQSPHDSEENSLQDEVSANSSSTKISSRAHGSQDVRNIMSRARETFARIKEAMIDTAVEDDEEIEHEITIHEDRMQKTGPSRRRNLTITFSSPIASIIQDVGLRHSDDDKNEGDASLSDQSAGSNAADSFQRGRRGNPRAAGGAATTSRSRSRSQGGPRSLSVKGRVFVPRPVSRIDEQDEDNPNDQGAPAQPPDTFRHKRASRHERRLSIRGDSSIVGPDTEDNRDNTSLSCVVATPAPTRTAPSAATPVIGRCVGNLSLTPLSEFTMHQVDPSCGLEVSYVVGDQYLVTGDGSKKILSKAIRNLVEKITEVEPFEPDWESMQELDLSDKQITTLHMLDEFCGSIVTLDASDNSIYHLDGVPSSVRNIRLTNNQLSELTAWGHLMNLQYVDVSNNQINSLHAFKDLIHLRTLRADNNEITSLDGINLHDSLQVLRARGNYIDKIDFDGTKLQRLTELDLENNQITSVQNLEQLTCLSTLNLQHNRLASFAPSTDYAMPCLKYLKLSNNDLATLDVSTTPSLRLLHVDRNRLVNITGFSRCRRLDSLSLREQSGDTPLDITSLLSSAYEVRKLFLSGNLLSSFCPRMDFLNLQYLELANCGLQTLAPELGQLMPNLRVLNLNYNALGDISALQYIPRLKKLLVAGNRLLSAGPVTDVLAGFPHLARLDFRDNPATLGFYPPVQTLVRVVQRGGGKEEVAAAGSMATADYDPFTLPDVDPDRDDKFASRLDMGTRMRRRLYEMIVLDRCRQLRTLDGLPAAREVVRARDGVWHALVECGIIDKTQAFADADADEKEKREGGEEGRGVTKKNGDGDGEVASR